MATQSVQKDRQGPDWPLGLIGGNPNNIAPGTPIGIMSLVDPSSLNAPETVAIGPSASAEFTERAYQIIFTACKAGALHGLVQNTGNIYIVRKGVQGGGNRDDYGSVVAVLTPLSASGGGFSQFVLTASALNRDVFSPYRYSIDADNAGDCCLVTLVMQ